MNEAPPGSWDEGHLSGGFGGLDTLHSLTPSLTHKPLPGGEDRALTVLLTRI